MRGTAVSETLTLAEWRAQTATQVCDTLACTLACEADPREAPRRRGHNQVVDAHEGALRGSNNYKGFDVMLAQVYHPNCDAIVREGRVLFADDSEPLDEHLVVTERTLSDAGRESWVEQVPTVADSRLEALLEQRCRSELVQAALRGWPFDHPEAWITPLFGLPLPQLPPTVVREGDGGADEQYWASRGRAGHAGRGRPAAL